nr:flagellar biosynthesis anti-sigma factor FlgM [uncultured Desulfobacter sp.]
MKINNNLTQQYINQSYAANNANANANTTANTSADQGTQTQERLADSINLSSTTKDLQRIATESAKESEARVQMVADLKEQVQTGQYTVNAEKVAEKIVGSILNEVG